VTVWATTAKACQILGAELLDPFEPALHTGPWSLSVHPHDGIGPRLDNWIAGGLEPLVDVDIIDGRDPVGMHARHCRVPHSTVWLAALVWALEDRSRALVRHPPQALLDVFEAAGATVVAHVCDSSGQGHAAARVSRRGPAEGRTQAERLADRLASWGANKPPCPWACRGTGYHSSPYARAGLGALADSLEVPTAVLMDWVLAHGELGAGGAVTPARLLEAVGPSSCPTGPRMPEPLTACPGLVSALRRAGHGQTARSRDSLERGVGKLWDRKATRCKAGCWLSIDGQGYRVTLPSAVVTCDSCLGLGGVYPPP
jgi:hypothetical protein